MSADEHARTAAVKEVFSALPSAQGNTVELQSVHAALLTRVQDTSAIVLNAHDADPTSLLPVFLANPKSYMDRLASAVAANRNFQIFYYLVAGATPEEHAHLGLLDKMTYRYLGQRVHRPTSGPDDALRFDQLKTCQLIAAILHLGSLEFIIDRSWNEDTAGVRDSLSPSSPLALIRDFLCVPARDIKSTLSYCTKLVKKELCTVFLDADGASDNRDDLAKTLYSLLLT
ncbi:P-loop containing nucleoside triphosphate hydrolase protein [Mycena sanguinolenta]|nr:P-loop containing nucleoside triphosphate hydrolase protein [Mycena sanguinolenta]